MRLLDRLVDFFGSVAAALLALIALGICAEILIRGFDIGSIVWMIEVVEYGLLAVTFLGAPWVLKQSAHVRVDVVLDAVSPRRRRDLEMVGNVTGAIVCVVLFVYGLRSTIELYALDTKIFKILTVREWWLFAVVPLSCLLMTIEFVRRIRRQIVGQEGGEDDAAPTGDTAGGL